ncbi:MAG: hypothetical protein R3D29_16725, partial [Nitratireductor sp.]
CLVAILPDSSFLQAVTSKTLELARIDRQQCDRLFRQLHDTVHCFLLPCGFLGSAIRPGLLQAIPAASAAPHMAVRLVDTCSPQRLTQPCHLLRVPRRKQGRVSSTLQAIPEHPRKAIRAGQQAIFRTQLENITSGDIL